VDSKSMVHLSRNDETTKHMVVELS